MNKIKKIIFSLLPDFVKATLFLKQLVIPKSQENIELKFAGSVEECEQAFTLLYKAYLDVDLFLEAKLGGRSETIP